MLEAIAKAGTCQATTRDGTPCRAPALTGQALCFTHSQDPETVQKRDAARLKGAYVTNAKKLPPDFPTPRLRGVGDVVGFAEETAGRVLRGEISPNMANSAGRLAEVALRAAELGLLAELDDLKKMALEQKVGTR